MILRCCAWISRWLLGAGSRPPLLFLALVAFLNFLLVGYEFAVDDQLLYLALVPRYFNPELVHPHDIYLQLFVSRTYTTLFLMLAPLLRFVDWEWPVFILYAAVKFFIFFGVWSIAMRLTRDKWAAALAVLFLLWNVIMKELTVQFNSVTFICRYAVIPLLYFGICRFWDKRYFSAAVLFGLAFQVHAMSAIYWLVIVGVCFAWNIRDFFPRQTSPGSRGVNVPEIKRLFLAFGVFIAFALPMILWSHLTPLPAPPPDFTSKNWFDYSYIWKGRYIFFSLWSEQHFWLFALCVFFLLIPLYRLWRDHTLKFYAPAAIGALLAMAAHCVATEWMPFHPLYQLQWYRAGDVLPLLATVGVARIISFEFSKPGKWAPAVAAACFLATITSEQSLMWFAPCAMALLVFMQLENKRPWLCACVIFFGIIPAVLWLQFFAAEDQILKQWSMPVFWGLACVLFAVMFYSQARLARDDAVASLKPWMRSAFGFLCFSSMVLLAFAVFYAPDWHHRYRRGQIGSRLSDCMRWLNGPGKALNNSSVRLQHWVRTNTPPQAMIFVPPGLNGFRVFSERSVFVEYFDGEVGIFSALMASEWQNRIRILGYDPEQNKSLGNARGVYRRMTAEQWQELSKKYNADYLVTTGSPKLPFEKLHQEGPYSFWRISMPEK